MVYNILVVDLSFDEKTHKYEIVKEIKTLIFSHNWNFFQKTWYIRKHLFNMTVKNAIEKMQSAWDYFKEEKIEVGKLDPNNPDWIWGLKTEGEKLVSFSDKELLPILYYVLLDLKKEIEPYQDSYLLDSDNPGEIIKDKVKYKYHSNDPNDSNDDTDDDVTAEKDNSEDTEEKATEDLSAEDKKI